MRAPLPRLFWVTDGAIASSDDFLPRARAAMLGGGELCAVQLRGRDLPGRRFHELALALREFAAEAGAGLWINDRVDVAVAVRSTGLQLGGGSLPVAAARAVVGRSCPIGSSVHGVAEARLRFEEGADLALLGSVFATGSHPGRKPLGLGRLRRAAGLGRPIVAIGGIRTERVHDVVEAGAWGAAVLSGIWESADPRASARAYADALRHAVSSLA